MLFNSAVFGLFMAILLPLYWAIRHNRSRKWILLVASYAFYGHWDYRYLSLLAISTLVDYAAGSRLGGAREPRSRRLWLFASLVTNLGILGIFKYGNFLVGTFGPLWEAIGITPMHFPDNIPVGISFYTFQTMSYTIDVYRGKTERCRSLLDFALYVSFFSQLVAGPIVRSTDFLPQVRRMKNLRADNLASGLHRFLLGLFKKIVLADNAGLFANTVFASPGEYSAPVLWCGVYAFALQIYCDFSGYSDMAIGLARGFGIKLQENFNAPYLSRSITEFWRRWHLSLSSWLRDYLYISLGGNRKGKRRTYVNLMLTMLLGGLWHGANWTFVFWGGFHGACLAVERAIGSRRRAGEKGSSAFVNLVKAIVTFHLVCLSWVMFRARGFPDMLVYLRRMFTEWTWPERGGAEGMPWAVLLACLVIGQWLVERRDFRRRPRARQPAALQGAALAVLILLVSLFYVDEVAFIYFQF